MSRVLASLALAVVVPCPRRGGAANTPPRTPKRAGVMGLALALAVAVSAVAAASAVASPEFHAATYPAKIEAHQLNNQGFAPSNAEFTSHCEVLEAKTKEEAGKPLEAKDLTADSPTLRVHPKYEKCILTVLGSTSGPATVSTQGCYYKFHAATPGTPAGTVDIECEAGKAIKIEASFLAGCEITMKPQSALGTVEYKNQPPGQEVEVAAELSKVKTLISPGCGTGKLENLSEYRETEVMGGNAKLAPPGHPAKLQFKGEVDPDPIEVALNEPHWYENHTALGTGEEAGEQALMWGKLVLTDAGGAGHIGSAECQTEWGGKVYNPQGVGGAAGPGEAKLVAFQAFNCVSEECKNKSATLTVTPEGLGVSGLSTLFWEAKLSGGPTRLKIGNAAGSATSIQWKVACTGLAYSKSWKGELAPELENGTGIGSAPSKLTFNLGELKVEGVTEGKVSNKLKLMGYEGGEIVSTKAP